MKLVNLTNHTINETTTGQEISPSGIVARVMSETVKVAEVGGMPIYQTKFGAVEGLPKPEEGTIYIVSSLTLNSVPKHRTDVVAPGNLQRNEHKQPIGCCGFRRAECA